MVDGLKRFFCKFYVAIVMIFMYAPILVLIVLSFNSKKTYASWGGFSLKWYADMFRSTRIMNAFGNTIALALISAVVATLIGLVACIGIDAMNKRQYSLVMTVTNIPMLNADIVTGIAMMLFFMSFMKLNFTSVLLAHITFNIPYVILNIMPRFNQIDVSTYEAARDLGGGPVYSFFKVILPEIIPGMLAGFFMAVTMSMDDFVITFFTKGAGFDNLSTMVYAEKRRGIEPSMYALSTVIFIITVLLLVSVNVLTAPKKNKREV